MIIREDTSIKLEDLGLAYRKAKVDLYYSSYSSFKAIADYEEKLHFNLSQLLAKINSDDESWVKSKDFTGTWVLAPKCVDMNSDSKDSNSDSKNTKQGLIFSCPAEAWIHTCNQLKNKENKKPEAQFRIMAKCTIDFHVLSTLWMLKVGHLFDEKLSKCAYGNRLRRTQEGGINKFSLGTFTPYLKPFRDWRDNGIEAMSTALEAGKKVIALTADIRSFYHELNPEFMLSSTFVETVLKLHLTDEQKKLHRLFICALQAWATETPLKNGLPVGLPASAVVANMALIELDRIIEQQIVPLYYGRYVDDIMLVMENGANFCSVTDLWEWLFIRSDGRLTWFTDIKNKEDKYICFQPDYLKNSKNESQIHFANSKNKVFMLSGDTGKALVNAIAHQILERASEWQAMPRMSCFSTNVATDLLVATQSNGEVVDNLRKADAMTMRRASFAIKLRDFEAYERDLVPEAWKDHRQAFFRAFIEHVLVLPQFFELSTYLARVIRLATVCEDFWHLREIINALKELCKQVEENCILSIKACSWEHQQIKGQLCETWKEPLFCSVLESINAAFPPRLSKAGKQSWEKFMLHWHEGLLGSEFLFQQFSVKDYQTQQARLFSCDLAHVPFRFISLPAELVAQRGIPAKKTVVNCKEAKALLPNWLQNGFQQLVNWMSLKELPYGVLFATRPFNLPELFILNKDAYVKSEQTAMQEVVCAVRGFKLNENTPCIDNHGVLHIPDETVRHKYGIAVSSWKTSMNSWIAAVMRKPDPEPDRYARLCKLLDSVIAQPQHSRYLILPELALPARWFMRIAQKLHRRGISLITGIEYLHAGKLRVHNQVWAALSHDGLGFPSFMIYRQDKQCPALHEEQELQRLAGLSMKPEMKKWSSGTPPIIQHGDFRFALLICSELTNISYRAALRGKVDALFVPEWNQDTDTFNALVESAALDIHAFIIQCNDRQYGDSRIRAPFKDSWKRDVLRVKGGVTDYCVIGEVDVQSLRQFQSSYRSSCKLFKPVPDGFEISYDRKVLPTGEIKNG